MTGINTIHLVSCLMPMPTTPVRAEPFLGFIENGVCLKLRISTR